ncbi:hypothetical protein GX50_07828 [[Emmonsia] crescens]|uniref:Uncharacterized protein n=1 Tax=[Emmonsia] crescens TaxID=73230 RepID=A0A2B7Z773_9EURO|nr:hypothetical protein GX50_07828 [Emmonsia crescens]
MAKSWKNTMLSLLHLEKRSAYKDHTVFRVGQVGTIWMGNSRTIFKRPSALLKAWMRSSRALMGESSWDQLVFANFRF